MILSHAIFNAFLDYCSIKINFCIIILILILLNDFCMIETAYLRILTNFLVLFLLKIPTNTKIAFYNFNIFFFIFNYFLNIRILLFMKTTINIFLNNLFILTFCMKILKCLLLSDF